MGGGTDKTTTSSVNQSGSRTFEGLFREVGKVYGEEKAKKAGSRIDTAGDRQLWEETLRVFVSFLSGNCSYVEWSVVSWAFPGPKMY